MSEELKQELERGRKAADDLARHLHVMGAATSSIPAAYGGEPVFVYARRGESPTWPIILAFAERMEAKLAKNRHKGGRTAWLQDDPRELLRRLNQEVAELEEAVDSGHAQSAIDEAADVANFALMVADWFTVHLPQPLKQLRHHVTGAIERGEAEAIAGIPAAPKGGPQ